MRFTFRQLAGEHERFAENAFDSQIGKVVPVNFRETEDGPVTASVGEARLVGVAILDQGKVAELTLETLVTDELGAAIAADHILKHSGTMSFSVKSQ